MSTASHPSRTGAAAYGVLVAVALALVCMYAQAFSWAVSRGALLDISLKPIAYPTPAVSWTFIVAAGMIVAACIVWFLRNSVAVTRQIRVRSAATTSALILGVAIVSQITSPGGGWSLEALPLWQRAGHFIVTSGAYVTFVGVLIIWSVSKLAVVSLIDTPAGAAAREKSR